jgi:Abnormal spindle-like microcephaly-assoc'd, ASPM-SPD-2-Hydin
MRFVRDRKGLLRGEMHMKSRLWYVTVFTLLVAFAYCGGGARPSIPPLMITTASLPNGTSEHFYSQTIQASGGGAPFTWTVSSGTLPHNLTLSSSATNAVTISGTPDTAAQGVAFTINVTDSANQSAAQAYTVSILLESDTLTLSPASLSFAPQLVGTLSGAQAETVTNTGTSAVLISTVALSGANAADFSQSNTCVSSLAAGANCTISVTFTASQFGPRSASITITDSTVGSPHSVSVNGIGLTSGPNATLSAASLTFAIQLVGTTSPAQSITLTNYGTTTLNITSITATPTTNFAETNTCAAGLASGASCTISVTFTPSATGSVTGTLSVTDNAPGTPQTVSLSGTGTTHTLTGRCWGEVQGTLQCKVATDLADCPAGQPAIPTRASGCVPPDSMLVDISRGCRFQTSTGARVQGECVVQ